MDETESSRLCPKILLGPVIIGGFLGALLAVGIFQFWLVFRVGEALVLGTALGATIGVATKLMTVGWHLGGNFLLVVVGLIWVFIFTGTIILTCKQVEPGLPLPCELIQSYFWGRTGKKFELRGASMGQWMVIGPTWGEVEDEVITIPYIELQTNNSSIILPYFATQPEAIISSINNYIKNPQKTSLVYQTSTSSVGYPGSILILISLFLAIRSIVAKRKANLKVS